MNQQFNPDGSLKTNTETTQVTEENKERIKNALILYGQTGDAKEINNFTPDKEADEFIKNDPLAFVFAVILDQGMKAEKVWAIPLELKKRLGHWDIEKIANIKEEELIKIFDEKPKLHRFPPTAAKRIKAAAELIVSQYKRNAENIWNDKPSSYELHDRFEEFEGIGQKKASMAANILVRDRGVETTDKKGIDVSYDIHIRRVFLRSGLVNKDDRDLMVRTARKLNPEYPGALDLPCWLIGRQWCHSQNPECDNCTIKGECLKLNKKLIIT
jgi:endonuclease III